MSLKIGGGTSQIYAGAGTTALPSISFAGAPTTGFYTTSGGFELSIGGVGYTFFSANEVRVGTGGQFSWSSNVDPSGAGPDVWMARGGVGSVNVGGANGALLGIGRLAENVIIAAAATSTSVIQLPAGAILLGVTSRVTTAGVTSWPATYSLAVGATTCSSGISTVANTTDRGTVTPIFFAATTAIVITPIGTPGDALGRIRCTIHYMLLTPATS